LYTILYTIFVPSAWGLDLALFKNAAKKVETLRPGIILNFPRASTRCNRKPFGELAEGLSHCADEHTLPA
jgi:hypothetical protein